MWSVVKTIAMVTLITVLIWLWAEAEGLRSAPANPRIQFVSLSNDNDVRIADPEWRGDSVHVRMQGSTVALDDVDQLLRAPIQLSPGVGGVPAEPGVHTVRLLDALRSHPDLVRRGITIQDVQPPTVTIRVSRMVTRDLPVRPDLDGLEVDGDVTVSPPTVSVRMPEQAATALGERGTVGGGAGGLPAATAILEENERRLLRDEGPQSVRARVVLPPVLNDFNPVTVQPETVRITLRIRKQTDEITLPTVPVWVTMPHTEGSDWDVRVQDGLVRNVTVRGPTDLIARVRSRELVPIAFVVLSSDELEAGITSKQAVFAPVWSTLIDPTGAPMDPTATRLDAANLEQVAPLQFSAENRRIGLQIRKRNGAATTPGATDPPVPPPPGGT